MINNTKIIKAIIIYIYEYKLTDKKSDNYYNCYMSIYISCINLLILYKKILFLFFIEDILNNPGNKAIING